MDREPTSGTELLQATQELELTVESQPQQDRSADTAELLPATATQELELTVESQSQQDRSADTAELLPATQELELTVESQSLQDRSADSAELLPATATQELELTVESQSQPLNVQHAMDKSRSGLGLSLFYGQKPNPKRSKKVAVCRSDTVRHSSPLRKKRKTRLPARLQD